MRRVLLFGLSLCSLRAQNAPPPAPSTEQRPAESPVPSSESWISGSVDAGYRWMTSVGGSFDTYRSIVNLGSGPKLFGAEFTITDPLHRAFDRIDVQAYSWGDDPYSTFHLNAKKRKWYDFTADYRNIAYFNFLPSYADPLLARGIELDEEAFDTRRRLTSAELELLPQSWFRPFLAFHRDSSSGTGTATFVSDQNEYPVPNQ
ncbi:MAG: hypothetical protein JOZ22_02965 [Acidobacteriia bacterium]|nr:hypothetical protein [Terriglobia bacterium]